MKLEQMLVVEREMSNLVGFNYFGTDRFRLPSSSSLEKASELYHICTDFRVLNDELIKVNLAFKMVKKCIQATGYNKE